jgi:hypothetical protein
MDESNGQLFTMLQAVLAQTEGSESLPQTAFIRGMVDAFSGAERGCVTRHTFEYHEGFSAASRAQIHTSGVDT